VKPSVETVAQKLWETNNPAATPLHAQGEALQRTYNKAAEAVLTLLPEQPYPAEITDQLAWHLAFEATNPMSRADGLVGALEDYQKVAGDRCADIVAEAVKSL
jgi:hypothetical protein